MKVQNLTDLQGWDLSKSLMVSYATQLLERLKPDAAGSSHPSLSFQRKHHLHSFLAWGLKLRLILTTPVISL